MMTVEELIRQLSTLPQDLPVVISIDAEGNQFKHLDESDTQYLDLELMDRMHFYNEDGTEADEPDPNVVILWPVN